MSRLLRLLGPLLVVVVVGCTAQDDDAPEPGPTQTTQTTQTTLPGVELAYTFEAGSVLIYEVDLHQDLTLETEGEASAVVDDDLPASADLTIEATGRFTFTVSDGPEDGTYRLDVEREFDDVTVAGTADGEDVSDPADVDQFGIAQPIASSMIVDSRGRAVAENPEVAIPLTGLALDPGGFVGPVLPEGAVSEGQSWTETYSARVLGEETAERTVTGAFSREELEGREVVVIDSESVTEATELDLAAFLEEFLLAMGEGDGDDTVPVDPDRVTFRMTIEPAASEGTARFDADRGLVIDSLTTGSTGLRMDVALPDRETGDIREFVMHLETRQTIEYSHVGGSDD